MKKSLVFVAALLAAVACGNQEANKEPAVPVQTVPSVEIAVAQARDVPQDNTYATTVLAEAVNNIAPQTAGRIRKINVEVGDYVVKGQILAEMDRLQLDQLELQVQNDEIEYERLKGLYKEGGVSQSDFEAAELGYKVRRTNLANVRENTILRSPISGFVTARNFDAGDLFTMSAPLFTVQQVTPVKLLVGISESEYSLVKKGDKVSLTVDALPGKTFSGHPYLQGRGDRSQYGPRAAPGHVCPREGELRHPSQRGGSGPVPGEAGRDRHPFHLCA